MHMFDGEDFLLSPKELEVLNDVRKFLSIPHSVQEYLASDHAPTVCWVLSAYTDLLDMLKMAHDKFPKIKHAIQSSISYAEKYMAYTRQSRMYALAMSES